MHIWQCALFAIFPHWSVDGSARDDDVFTIVVALLRCHFGQWLIENRTREGRYETNWHFLLCGILHGGDVGEGGGGYCTSKSVAWLSYNPFSRKTTMWACRFGKWFRQGYVHVSWLKSRWLCFVNQFVSNSVGEQYVLRQSLIRSLSCVVFIESHRICPLAYSPLLTLSRPRLLHFIHLTLNMKDISQLKIRGERGVRHCSRL